MNKSVLQKTIRLFLAPNSENTEIQEVLKNSGYTVDAAPFTGPVTLRQLKENPPDLVIIDLTRRPSTGRDIGIAIRHYQTTRSIPLVFVGDASEKVAAIKNMLPDAVFAGNVTILDTVKTAMTHPPQNPIKPDSLLAGYAGTPLPGKLGIKAKMSISLVNAPADFEQTLCSLPEAVKLKWDPSPDNDLLLWFIKSQHELKNEIERILPLIGKGGIWIIWPKKGSKIPSDLTQNEVRQTGLAAGLVDYKISAIDTTWSGLKFAWRKTLK